MPVCPVSSARLSAMSPDCDILYELRSVRFVYLFNQPRTQALWFVYVIKRTWDGTRGRKMENSAGSAW
jgi:hypothetical protein